MSDLKAAEDELIVGLSRVIYAAEGLCMRTDIPKEDHLISAINMLLHARTMLIIALDEK